MFEPNRAHYALSLLCVPSCLATVAPSATFTLITQNIDELSTRALERTIAGLRSSKVDTLATPASGPRMFEMHGRVLDTLCTGCGDLEHSDSSPLCQALVSSDLHGLGREVTLDDLPHCAHCGALLHPGVVWFEELPRHSREIWVVDAADLCLVIGTSSIVDLLSLMFSGSSAEPFSQVQPAVAYIHEVADHGGKVAVFNTGHTDGDEERDFLGPCEEIFPEPFSRSLQTLSRPATHATLGRNVVL